MPTYKLTYFPGRGRAELARILFNYTDTPFEDIRVKGEEWKQLKESGKPPFGLLPILEVDDGTVISSSAAIASYIADVTGLTADTPLDRARSVMVIDVFGDIFNPMVPKYFTEKDPAKKAELSKEFVEKTLPPWVDKLEAVLKQNSGGDKWFVGSKLTVLDISFFNFFDFMGTLLSKDINELLPKDKVPKMAALWAKVKALPKIAAYLEKRPPPPHKHSTALRQRVLNGCCVYVYGKMPTYKLTYFPTRGRAELARILFNYTDTPFEDIRVTGEEWKQLKASGKPPFGLLPILEVDDGTVISSSAAIASYIADVTGLLADTPLDRARSAMVTDVLGDIINAFIPKYFSQQDPEKKAEVGKEFVEETLPLWLDKLEAVLKQNSGGDKWFVGSKLTIIDISFFNFFDSVGTLLSKDINEMLPKDKVPKMAALFAKVKALPNIAAYLEKRPPPP
ncbi:uncharacterized protein LOC134196038 [Corticium candelabrum]|uniref:uncharacterized protein LOC134196038 n=1 Tax=Corticium candelabrum TaxID=121492 RepID=UPI002E27118B|nr:uncharacterized protein LOC134196038 [Corticium candelabrum]